MRNFFRNIAFLVLMALAIAVVLRITISNSATFWFGFVLLVGFPIVVFFGRHTRTSMNVSIAWWIFLFFVYIVPAYSPGIYDGVTGRLAFWDYLAGENVRPPDNGGVTTITGNECKQLRMQIEDEYSAKSRDVLATSQSVVQKEASLRVARQAADKDLATLNTGLCKSGNTTTKFVEGNNSNSQSSAASGNSNSGSGQVAKTSTVTVPANVKWFNTGVCGCGKQVRITYKSGMWTNGGENPLYADGRGGGPWQNLIVPSAPIRSLVAKGGDGSGFYVGNQWSGTIPGQLYLSMNDTDNFADNKNSVTVQVDILE